MRLASSGKINTTTILLAVNVLNRQYSATSLPVCVDFDHVFDIANPARCAARSNVDNPSENLFYITKPSQTILNQVEANCILPGKYFAMLPCKSLAIEDSANYANNLVLTAFSVSVEDETADLVAAVQSVYDAMGLVYTVNQSEETPQYTDFVINGITVGQVETLQRGDKFISIATVVSEPVFSYAVSLLL